MKCLNGLVLASGVFGALAFGFTLPAAAEISSVNSMLETRSSFVLVKADDDKSDSASTSDADKRARAADCSKQADAKHLHGEARKKFRSSCKRQAATKA